MALVTNSFNGLYGGVNQQSAELRLDTQVEEMINAYPTLDKGLLKRNPTKKLNLSNNITYDENMWIYEYDRGLAGESEEKYSIIITKEGLQIINVLTGKVYTHGDGITFGDEINDANYLNLTDSRGFAATTVKDVTFIANKHVNPKIDSYVKGAGSTEPITVAEDTIWFNTNPTKSFVLNDTHARQSVRIYQNSLAPCSAAEYVSNQYTSARAGASTTGITIDNSINIIYEKPEEEISRYTFLLTESDRYTVSAHTSYSAYIENLKNEIIKSVDSAIYNVDIVLSSDKTKKGIRIKKIDGSGTLITDASITIHPLSFASGVRFDGTESDYYNSTDSTTYQETITIPSSKYLQEGYIWIKGSNPSSAYTYSYALKSDTAYYASSVSSTTTEGAATAILNDINTNASDDFIADSGGGSVIRIRTVDSSNFVLIYAGDSYGDQASFAWTKEVQYLTDLPKNMPFDGALVNVIGDVNSDSSYWLEYSGGQWKEGLGYNVQPKINPTTMPHVLIRNGDDSFTFKEYTWEDCKVGDTDSNEPPSFTQDGNVIKDIFFFKNRLGFITNKTVIFSEVGVYNNFWATSVAAVLDSDRIDTTVDTTKVIQLEYATYLEDNLMLFSDKAQFKLSGGRVLSPKDIQISQTSAYEINKNIRPLFMNDKVFFCAKRGDYTAVMQYSIIGAGRISEAIDISSHIQSYIPKNVTRLSGSTINNMLFISNSDLKDTLFVYKYYDSGNTRVQSSWFKWTFNGDIYSAFSLGRNLNILINRIDNSVSPSTSKNQFEIMPIFPQDYTNEFLDDSTSTGNETIIPTEINMGEWVFSNGGKKDIRGHLQFKTMQVSSEASSSFELQVNDINRNTSRIVNAKYTVDRKPTVYGDAKNVRISILNSDIIGFRINTISYEGNFNKRSVKR